MNDKNEGNQEMFLQKMVRQCVFIFLISLCPYLIAILPSFEKTREPELSSVIWNISITTFIGHWMLFKLQLKALKIYWIET